MKNKLKVGDIFVFDSNLDNVNNIKLGTKIEVEKVLKDGFIAKGYENKIYLDQISELK